MRSLAIGWMGFVLVAVSAQAAKYELDPSHTEVGFSVKHLMITNVKGRFDKPLGKFEFDSKTMAIKGIEIEMDAQSINTNDGKRDEHLRSPDFFDVQKFPKVIFKSDGGVLKNNEAEVKGKLTLHGVTKDVVLKVNYNGETEFMGSKRIAFTAKTDVKRKDFGITWNKPLDKGGLALGEDVLVIIEGEAIQQDVAAKK